MTSAAPALARPSQHDYTYLVAAKTEHYAELLAALGHPARLEVLRFVVQAGADGAAAGEIQAHLDVPASTLSHHLKRLLDAGLLKARLESNFHYYAAEYGAIRALTDYLWEDCCKRGKPGCC
jgi:DNA-binding transcriptional ArsR family regulator